MNISFLLLVVSPLKALIVDQVEALRELGYERVAYASSDLSPEQKNEVYRRVREGEVDLFIFPLNYCWRMISVIL